MKTKKISDLVFAALGIALVFLATYLIKIPNGIQGYFNLGDGFIMLFSSILSPFLAFMVGGVGSALADVAGGYGIYFLPTLIIKGLEAILISYLLTHFPKKIRIVPYLLGGTLMVIAYAIVDAWINESWTLAITGIPANILQAIIGVGIAMIAYPLVAKYRKDKT